MRIALDAMGGDDAPGPTVRGAFAVAEDGFQVLLVGDEAVLHAEISKLGGLPPNLSVRHASEFIEMEDAPISVVRRKRDSSLRVAFELVRRGQADAVVTMGNSGAALAAGMFVCKRLDGIHRPAIAGIFPGKDGPVLVLDIGANIDCKPEHLAQFAALGVAFAQVAFVRARPSVAILSNGEEREKGTELTRAAATLLEGSALDFRGYVEPKELFASAADVVVTDGWTGNLVLKTAEAVASHFERLAREAARTSTLSKVGALMLKPALKRVLPNKDDVETAGGILLGIAATAVVGHGNADEAAVASALRFAERLVEGALLSQLRAGLRAAEPIEPASESRQ